MLSIPVFSFLVFVPVVDDAAAKGLSLPFSGSAEGENNMFCLQDKYSCLLR